MYSQSVAGLAVLGLKLKAQRREKIPKKKGGWILDDNTYEMISFQSKLTWEALRPNPWAADVATWEAVKETSAD